MGNIKYLVCAPHRVGSNLLFSLLVNIGLAKVGESIDYEKLHHSIIRAVKIDWEKKDLREFFNEIFESTKTPRGVAGVKIQWSQLEDFVVMLRNSQRYKNISVEDVGLYLPVDTRYIYLTRRDKPRQAISCVKAFQTQIWSVKRCQEIKPLGTSCFDFDTICKMIIDFKRQERAWQRFFKKNGISPLRLEYEEYIKDYWGTVVRILEYLGLPVPQQFVIETDMVKQSDALSEEWVLQYYKTRIHGWIFFYVRKYVNGIRDILYRTSACLKEYFPCYVWFIKKLKGGL